MWLQERLSDLRRFPWFQEGLHEFMWNMRWGGVKSLGEFFLASRLLIWWILREGGRRGDVVWGEFQIFSAMHFDFLFVFVLHVAARRGSCCRQPWHWGRRPLLLQWAWYCSPLILIIDDKDNKQSLLVTMKWWKKCSPRSYHAPLSTTSILRKWAVLQYPFLKIGYSQSMFCLGPESDHSLSVTDDLNTWLMWL